MAHRAKPKMSRLQLFHTEDRIRLPRHLDVRMPHDIRQRGQITAVLEKLAREAMTKAMGIDRTIDAGLERFFTPLLAGARKRSGVRVPPSAFYN